MIDPTAFPRRPFHVAEIAEFGLSRHELREGVEHGHIRRLLTGVYVPDGLPDTMGLRLAATRLVVSPGHIVRDRTAAWVHGVDVFGAAERGIVPPIETCVLPTVQPTERAGVDGRTRDLSRGDLMQLDGLTITTPLRTALDLGALLKRRTALGGVDQLMRRHALTRTDLLRELPRFAGRRGVRQLREIVALADPRSESMRESWTRLAIHDAGLPVPNLQVEMVIDGVVRRLDMVYEAERVVIEYDGEEFHGPEQQQDDEKKRDWLCTAGYVVIVVRKDDFEPNRLEHWLGQLREELSTRSTTMRWPRRNGRDRAVPPRP